MVPCPRFYNLLTTNILHEPPALLYSCPASHQWYLPSLPHECYYKLWPQSPSAMWQKHQQALFERFQKVYLNQGTKPSTPCHNTYSPLPTTVFPRGPFRYTERQSHEVGEFSWHLTPLSPQTLHHYWTQPYHRQVFCLLIFQPQAGQGIREQPASASMKHHVTTQTRGEGTAILLPQFLLYHLHYFLPPFMVGYSQPPNLSFSCRYSWTMIHICKCS